MPSPLDDNLARLLAVAPRRERLSAAARARLTSALEESLRPSAKARPAPLRLAVVAAGMAAIFLGLVLGGRALLGDRAPAPSDEVHVAGVDPPSGPEGPRDPSASGGSAIDGGRTTPGVRPVSGGAAGERTVAAVDPADGVGSTPPRDAGAAADPGASLLASIALDDAVVLAPDSVSVWVRPVVPLPRVADAVRFEIPWSGSARRVESTLANALGPARAFGATHVHVQASAAGAAPAWTRVPLDELADGPVSLTLAPGRDLTGFVIDQRSGTPLDDALVVVVDQVPLDALDVHPPESEPLPEPHARTDGNGAFRLTHVAPRDSVLLRASRAGYAPSWLRVRSGATEPVTLALGAGGTVRGTVERPDGTRWTNATVILSRQEGDPGDTERPLMTFGGGRAASDGTYRVEDLPPGHYVALNFGDAREAVAGPLEFRQVELRGTETVEVNFLARQSGAAGSFAGVLRDAGRSPLPGVALTLMRVEAGEATETDWRATESSEAGEFVFADLAPAEYTLLAARDGFRHMEAIWTGKIDGPLERDIELSGIVLEVRCQRIEDGAPAAQAWVILESYDRARESWTFAGRGPASDVVDGAAVARFDRVVPGSYRGWVLGAEEGLGSVSVGPVRVEAGASAVLAAAVPAGGTLQVRAVDGESGAPVPGLTVQILDASGRPVPQQSEPTTGPDGTVGVQNVAFGDVTVEFRRGDVLLRAQPFAFSGAGDRCEAVVAPR